MSLGIPTSHPQAMNREARCWAIQDCYSCTHSTYGCGWCPLSSTCVPARSILSPITSGSTCPLQDERFELRTRAFGCACSTTTLLSIIVTVLATVAACLLLFGIALAIKRLNQVFGAGSWHGWEIEVKDDGTRHGRPWRRSNGFMSFWRYSILKVTPASEQERVTERSRLLG
ncbi:hypothetical protein M433DRAFT_269295 [Acidomyces richmondensis BFW]|nr:MAG: hypothetical protein FE78DRAFT_419068 [Acidomyces sp. 'richmondensis']KYG45123.1 hypothetical protein M433DRAFT_269295 [Acidomyces richmondensis BFW]